MFGPRNVRPCSSNSSGPSAADARILGPFEVGYRSGHTGIASKAIGGSRPPRVQIPPPPPPLHSPTETCGSGLTGTPGERVTSQEVQGFKSLRLRYLSPQGSFWDGSLSRHQ